MHKLYVTALGIMLLGFTSACGGGNGGDGAGESGDGAPYPDGTPTTAVRGEFNFATLMNRFSQGSARKMPWAGYWWPYASDGIYDAALSYEAATGQGGAANWEASRHGSGLRGLQSWWGHCNGWAAAAVLFEEPKAPKTVNGVQFSVSEQKQLLSEIGMEVKADFFGYRNNSNNPDDGTFQDMAPNQFFLVLTNYLGSGYPVIMDRYTGNQVWNHPIAGYQVAPVTPKDYLGTLSSAPNLHRVMVTMTMFWVRDDVSGGHQTEAFAFADGPSYESRTLRFEVWLDGAPTFSGGNLTGSGKVVLGKSGQFVTGGQWRNSGLELANSHPDYMWVPSAVTPSTGYTNQYLDVNFVSSTFGR